MAALYTNGTIVVWRTSDKTVVAELHHVAAKIPSVLFGKGETLITAFDEQILQIVDFSGKCLSQFNVQKKIASFKRSPKGNELVVLTKNNQFHFYSLRNGRYLGYIPAWNESEVSCYSFSDSGEKLLVGHDDGSIYILDVDKVYFAKNKVPGVYSMYDVDTGEQWDYDAGELVRLDKDNAVVKLSAHNLEARASYKYSTSKYYNHGIDIQAGYMNDRLVKKFYFGALVDASVYFPNDKYPYKYSIGGVTVKEDPYMTALDLHLVAGKFWEPIPSNTDFTLFVEAVLGGGARFMINRVYGSGDANLGFFGSVSSGLRWKGLTVYLTGGFDTTMNGIIGAGIGYRKRITPKVRAKGEKNSE